MKNQERNCRKRFGEEEYENGKPARRSKISKGNTGVCGEKQNALILID